MRIRLARMIFTAEGFAGEYLGRDGWTRSREAADTFDCPTPESVSVLRSGNAYLEDGRVVLPIALMVDGAVEESGEEGKRRRGDGERRGKVARHVEPWEAFAELERRRLA